MTICGGQRDQLCLPVYSDFQTYTRLCSVGDKAVVAVAGDLLVSFVGEYETQYFL